MRTPPSRAEIASFLVDDALANAIAVRGEATEEELRSALRISEDLLTASIVRLFAAKRVRSVLRNGRVYWRADAREGSR